jgi:hypothetical protein
MSRSVRTTSPLNFVNWSLGHETRWPVRVSLSSPPADVRSFAQREDMLYRRWVVVREERKLIATLPGTDVTLDFIHPAHLRQARQWLKASPRPFLQRLELTNPFVTESEGDLCFVRGALPGRLEGRLFIVIPPEIPVRSPVPSQGEAPEPQQEPVQQRMRRFSRAVTLTSGQEQLLVVASPLLLVHGADAGALSVVVFLSTGERLICCVEGPPGAEYLRVTAIEAGERQAVNARLLAVPDGVRFAAAPPDSGTDLTLLQPRSHENLAFWIQYEREALLRAEAAFAGRRGARLEYDEASRDAQSNSWLLRLVNGQAALNAWAEQGQRPSSREIDVDANIELRALDNAGEGCGATLLSLKDEGLRVIARVHVNRPEVVPPSPGKIVAAEQRGDITQRKRRNQALQRLQTGRTACPELLQWLYAPQLVPPVTSRADVVHARAGHAQKFVGMQSLAIRGAAQCPGIFLIQGPPGTGKTSVIVEIVHELRRRYRKREEEHGPIRILIASVQNEAVHNVVERLQMDRTGLQVQTAWLRDSDALSHVLAAKAAQLAERAKESSLARTPQFMRYAALQAAHELLSAFVEALGEHGLTGGVISLGRHVVAADPVRAVLPTLSLREIEEVLGFLGVSVTSSDDTEAIVDQLRTLCDMAPPWNEASQSSALRSLDVIASWPDGIDERLRRVVSLWRCLRPLVSVALDHAPLAAKLHVDWGDAVTRTRAALPSDDDAQPEEEDGFAHPQLGAIRDWAQSAVQGVHAELRGAEASVEAAIFDWLQTLERAPREMEGVLDRYAPVAAATCQRSARAAPTEQIEEADFFDVAIIDEAARAGIDVLIPMTLARSVVLVGDQLQLPPYVEDDLVRRVDQGVLERGSVAEPLFTYLWRRLPSANRVSLTTQYRMHEEIGRIVSKVFYEPDIVLSHFHSGERAHNREPLFGLLENQPVAWINTADVLQARGAGGYRWPCYEENAYEAEVVLRLLSLLRIEQLRDLLAETGHPPVGVISFYRAQKERLETSLRATRPDLATVIDVGTVDGFQGREFPLVILSCVRSNASGNVGFLSRLPQRINVAMSRAQCQLIVVGDATTLAPTDTPGAPERGSEWLRQVHGMIAERARVYASAKVMADG